MTFEQMARIANDPRLSSDAMRVILHVASLGPAGEVQLVKGEDLAILLHGGEKPIRAAIKRAEHCGYLVAEPGGRAGHKLTLLPEPESLPQGRHFENDAPQGVVSEIRSEKTTPPGEAFPRNDSPRGGNSASVGGGYMGGENPPPTDPSPPPPPTARVRARPSDMDVARLRDHLGTHAGAVDMMLDSADHPTTWIAAVLGKYGPSGTQQRAFTGIPPDRWPAVLATALMEFATAGKPYDNRHFDGFIRKAVENECRPPAEQRATGTDGRRAARPDAAAVGGAAGKPAGRASRYEFHYE